MRQQNATSQPIPRTGVLPSGFSFERFSRTMTAGVSDSAASGSGFDACRGALRGQQEEPSPGPGGNGDGSHCNVPWLARTGPMVLPIR